jgi:hypothetical protein
MLTEEIKALYRKYEIGTKRQSTWALQAQEYDKTLAALGGSSGTVGAGG